MEFKTDQNMTRQRMLWCAAIIGVAATGCSSTDPIMPDVGNLHDQTTSPPLDSQPDVPGAVSPWGVIEGQCDVLDDQEWNATESFLFLNAIDFDDQVFDLSLLSDGGRKIWEEDNLGGSSIHSEILAFEMLHRCEGAELLKTERKIVYLGEGKRTDLLLLIDGHKVGVSVTRAYYYPLEEAQAKLQEKLSEVLLSAANADPEDAWTRSILQIVASDEQYAMALQSAYGVIDPAIRDKTLLMVTVTNGADQVLYQK